MSRAGQSRIVRAPQQTGAPADRLVLTGDDTDFDNTLFVRAAAARASAGPLPRKGSRRRPAPSLYYLRARAFQRRGGSAWRSLARTATLHRRRSSCSRRNCSSSAKARPMPPLASARQFAREGGKIVVLPLTSDSSEQALSRLLGVRRAFREEAPVKDYAMLAQIDFQHPLFAAFADPRFSDFTKIHFWKYRRLDPAQIPGARDSRALRRRRSGASCRSPLGKGSVGRLHEQLAPRRQPARALVEVRPAAPRAARAEQRPARAEGAVFRRRRSAAARQPASLTGPRARRQRNRRRAGREVFRHRSARRLLVTPGTSASS